MLDQMLLLRSKLIQRKDSLVKTSNLFILVAIKYLNAHKLSSTTVSVHYFLKKARRSLTPSQIATHLIPLIADGYIIKKKSAIRITEAGKQALNELDKQLKQARYAYGRTKPATKPGNRPKPLI